MEELSQMNWPIIISIIGLLIAGAELYLIVLDRRRPQEEREKSSGLRIFHALKKAPLALKRMLHAFKHKRMNKGSRVFISYKRDIEPDEKLAQSLVKSLRSRGHQPYIDKELTVGIEWSNEIHRQIERSNFLVILLSKDAAASEMVAEELKLAEKSRADTGHPIPLPVRVNYAEALPYHLQRYLGDLHYILWTSEEDDLHTQDALFKAIEGGLELPQQKVEKPTTDESPRPEPTADPRLLEIPAGAVEIKSRFYIERDCDAAIDRQVYNPGSTTTIRAGRQMGKTSLLVRAVRKAKKLDYRVVYIDFQQINRTALSSLDHLLKYTPQGAHRISSIYSWNRSFWMKNALSCSQ
jgi:hypothetical protein